MYPDNLIYFLADIEPVLQKGGEVPLSLTLPFVVSRLPRRTESLSLMGPFFGLGILIWAAALSVSGWNEYRNVATVKTLQAGRAAVKEAQCSRDNELDGELVHLSCSLSGVKPLGSTIIGIKDIPSDDRVGLLLRATIEVSKFYTTSYHVPH